MTVPSEGNGPTRMSWLPPVLRLTLAFVLALGIGFLAGQFLPLPPDDLSTICRNLPAEAVWSDCISLRSAIAVEEATSIARWALWLSFGTMLASVIALVGLINAFLHGQRNIALTVEANRIALQNGKSQSRAYVVVEAVKCQLSEDGRLVTRVKFQNSGLSPALRIRWLYNAHLEIVENAETRHNITLSDDPDLEKSHWREDIPAGKCWRSRPLALQRNDEAGEAMKQAAFIAVAVKIIADYQDVFGSTHKLTACFQGRLGTDGFDKLMKAQDDAWEKTVKLAGA